MLKPEHIPYPALFQTEETMIGREVLNNKLFVGIRVPQDWDLPQTDFGNKMRNLLNFIQTKEFSKFLPNLEVLSYSTYNTEYAVIVPTGLPINSGFYRFKKFFAEIDITQLQALLYKFELPYTDPDNPDDLQVEIEMLEGYEMWRSE